MDFGLSGLPVLPSNCNPLPHVKMLIYLNLQCLTDIWDSLTARDRDLLEMIVSDLCPCCHRQSNTYWEDYV